MSEVHYFSQVQQNEGWRMILDSFARFVQPAPQSLVLDVGCGPAALVGIFRREFGARAFGADAEIGMGLAISDLEIRARFGVGKLPKLPYADNTFETITATNVIYLVDDPAAALAEISRILRPQGTFAMLNPSEKMSIAAATALADERGLEGFARQNFIHWGEMAEAKYRWSEDDLRQLFAAANLSLTETRLRVGDGLARYAKGQK